SLSYSPLFQVLLVLQNTPGLSLRLPGVLLESLGVETKTARFDLLLALTEAEGGLEGELIYDRDLFDRTTIVRFAAGLERLLAGGVADPGRVLSGLSVLSAGERHQLLWEWNDPGTEGGHGGPPLHRRFEAQVDRAPDAVAVVARGERLTYGEL